MMSWSHDRNQKWGTKMLRYHKWSSNTYQENIQLLRGKPSLFLNWGTLASDGGNGRGRILVIGHKKLHNRASKLVNQYSKEI